MKNITPSVYASAFSCPLCGAFTSQTWSSVFVNPIDSARPLPFLIGPGGASDIDLSDMKDDEERDKLIQWADKMASGQLFLDEQFPTLRQLRKLQNAHMSSCFNCKGHALWLYNAMIHPIKGEAPPANPDMSDDIRRDYEEASAIMTRSPRGAAALARLAIQKLCKEMGQSGKNINADIGALVAEGLDKRIQQALDVVRVIGNEAVHPGQIDLRDDQATAETLLKLVNMIVDKLVSEPKHIDELYTMLPEGARKAISERDKT